jgi:hypothetical protein
LSISWRKWTRGFPECQDNFIPLMWHNLTCAIIHKTHHYSLSSPITGAWVGWYIGNFFLTFLIVRLNRSFLHPYIISSQFTMPVSSLDHSLLTLFIPQFWLATLFEIYLYKWTSSSQPYIPAMRFSHRNGLT